MSANETSTHVAVLWTSEDTDLILVLIAQMKTNGNQCRYTW